MNDQTPKTGKPDDGSVSKEAHLTPIEAIDQCLKNEKHDELNRGILIADRERCYVLGGGKARDFAQDTAKKTGICISTVRRLRRIGALPPVARTTLMGSKFADRQDLLVWLSDKLGPVAPERHEEFVRHFMINPPELGTKKAPKQEPDQSDVSAHVGPVSLVTNFRFNGDDLDVVRLPDGDVGVSFHRLCELVGVGFSSQARRLNRTRGTGALWATVVTVATVAADGKVREMAILPRPAIPMWAATLEASRCAPEARRKLTAFQDEAANVLAAVFLPDAAPLMGRVQQTMERWFEGSQTLTTKKLAEISTRLAALEKGGLFGSRTLRLIPQVEPGEDGYSMESMVHSLLQKGFNLSKTDDAPRDIAVRLKLIGDLSFGWWNPHYDTVNRPLTENWRFNEAGAAVIAPHMLRFCELKMAYETVHAVGPREKALQEVLDGLSPVGVGEYKLLTRDRRSIHRDPFPGIRGLIPKEDQAPTGLYKLVLVSAGNNKIQVIKAIRSITGLSLKEAKDITEHPKPVIVMDRMARTLAEVGHKLLVEAGAGAVIDTTPTE